MTNCEKCRFPLPKSAEYCPSCGFPVKKISQISLPSTSVGKVLQASLLGAFISITISILVPPGIPIYFLPSFVSSLVAIYLFRARRLDQAIMVSFATYLFADAIFGGMFFGSLYLENIMLSQAYVGYVLTLLDIFLYITNPLTAIVAGYIGFRFMGNPKKIEQKRFSYDVRKESRGGIIYSMSRKDRKILGSSSHKI